MTDDIRTLVAEIKSRAEQVRSLVASYQTHFEIFGQSFDSSGRVFFRYPACYRADGILNGQRIILVSDSDKLQRFFADQNILWEVDLKELKADSAEATLPDYFRYGFSDIRHPFNAVDESSLIYDGPSRLGGTAVHRFSARTRNDFDIQYKGVTWPTDVKLSISAESCLLHELVGTRSGTQMNLKAHYDVEGVNTPIDDSLFTVEPTSPGMKKVDITIMTRYLLFPHSLDQGASMN